jgi:hypothetical protein
MRTHQGNAGGLTRIQITVQHLEAQALPACRLVPTAPELRSIALSGSVTL